MDSVDTAWLRSDNDVNRMEILGVWLLRPGITLAMLRKRLHDKLLKFERFRRRAVVGTLSAQWEDDPGFDLRHHLVAETLKPRRGQSERAALQQLAGELSSQPLDPARPLWKFHLVENCLHGSALICRVHHCIGDGVALSMVMMAITDGGPTPPDHATAADASWLGTAGALLKHPQGSLVQAAGWAAKAPQVVSDALSLAFMPNDSPTRLKGRCSGHKRVAWCPPLPLDRIKAVGHALGCSVNDVLVSCASGAIGRHLARQGDDPRGLDIRAMVPVNLRAPHEPPWGLGNRFGLAPLLMPIGIDNPIERLYEVRRRMAALKDNFQPLLAYGVLAASGLLVKPGQDVVMRYFQDKTTAVVTNVRGPDRRLHLCGAEVCEVIFWVPSPGDVGLGVSIISYADGVQFGLRSDAALCPEPQKIIDEFVPEFDKLTLLTLMLPWDAARAQLVP
ncbi:MAG: wax ester/triacylglycerol synthase family O-acyltransferase [Rhizobacter sp.]|nr:wax ester/triacylglycerol synthase family O-acyltransferase [Rhizobacter sp.]